MKSLLQYIGDMFKETSSFSMRRALTLVGALLFISAFIMYYINETVIPNQYLAILTLIFAFYFGKDRLRKSNNSQ